MEHKIFTMPVSAVYPHYKTKVERKGVDPAVVDACICWLTGYSPDQLHELLDADTNFTEFFSAAPHINPARDLIGGSICGVKIPEIDDPLMKLIRQLDKLIDDAAKGKYEKMQTKLGLNPL
ncbi:DUF2200 domain-containing protein [Corynebacterium felinum]|nr:DUF2200 domain-containing protein [Corynebacterium felinum]MDF5820588.1 DUF2200 domain-containing protein [Corynebacterium felinum]